MTKVDLSWRWVWVRVAIVAVAMAMASAAVMAQDDDPPAQAGRISSMTGAVSVQPAGSQDWGQAYSNFPLGPGDRLFTDVDGYAEIQLGHVRVRVGPQTDITLVEDSANSLSFGLAQGAAIVHVSSLWPDQSLYVQTPNGTITVNQLADIRVDVMPQEQTALFSDRRGQSYVSGAGDFGANMADHQALQLAGTNPVYSQWVRPTEGDGLEDWSRRRDAQLDRVISWQYVSPDMPGAEELDANGTWLPASDYGPVWFPNVAAGWAPYRNGHWAHRAPWGWVWVEDEPWGAPFHYGRWVTINGRWGWVPGPREAHPVWAPALVVFVGGQPGMSAWIALGPGEPYRPWYHCSDRYIDEVNRSNIRPAPRVVVQTTYVNVVNVNVTYVNRTSVTVVRQEDMSAGRPVARAAVRVDPQAFAHVNVVVAPTPPSRPTPMVMTPPARPVSVAAARPVLINAKGQMVTAQPHAQPMAAPVRPVSAPKPPPGSAVVAAPPGAQMRQASQGRQPQMGGQPGAGGQPRTPGATPGTGQTNPSHFEKQPVAPAQGHGAAPAVAQPPTTPPVKPMQPAEQPPAPRTTPKPAQTESPAPHPQVQPQTQQKPQPQPKPKPEGKDKTKDKDKEKPKPPSGL